MLQINNGIQYDANKGEDKNIEGPLEKALNLKLQYCHHLAFMQFGGRDIAHQHLKF
jgi:hypothetical protein